MMMSTKQVKSTMRLFDEISKSRFSKLVNIRGDWRVILSMWSNGHFPWHCLKFPDVFHQFCQMSKFPWHSVKFPDNSLTLRNFISPWHFPDGYEPCWMTHICVGKLTIIGSDNGLSPGRHQAIIWNNAGLLLIEPLGTNFREIAIRI